MQRVHTSSVFMTSQKLWKIVSLLSVAVTYVNPSILKTVDTTYLSASPKLRKVPISFVMSVRTSAWNNSATHWTDFHDIWYLFFENMSRKFKFHYTRTRITGGLNVGRYPSQPVSVLWPLPYPVTRLPNGKANFEPNPFSYNTPTFLNLIHSSHNHLTMKMERSVPKRRHTKFRRRGITQKKAYNI
jgi:hypothetical protein